MAWNRGSEGATPVKAKAKPSPVRGIVAGLVVVVAVVACYFAFFSASEKQQKVVEQKKPTTIKEVKPAPAPKPIVEEEDLGWVTNRKGQVVKKRKPETYRDERGVLRYKAGGARAPEEHEFDNPIKISTASNHPEFKHSCENEIATLLTIEPGDMLAGEPNYGERFKKDFIQALLEPIEINEDDSERDKEIKRLVEEQKHELAKRIKDGEDLETIFTEARAEARRLAAVRNEIVQMAHEMASDGQMSEQEMTDCYEAANKMLEAKGLEPMKYGGIMKRRMMLSNRAKMNQTTKE